jgi:hypothetical protein
LHAVCQVLAIPQTSHSLLIKNRLGKMTQASSDSPFA